MSDEPYCLRCYAPLPADRKACLACGFPNLRVDRARFWNKEPALFRLESVLQIVGAVVCVALGYGIFSGFVHMGTGAGWAILTPAL